MEELEKEIQEDELLSNRKFIRLFEFKLLLNIELLKNTGSSVRLALFS